MHATEVLPRQDRRDRTHDAVELLAHSPGRRRSIGLREEIVLLNLDVADVVVGRFRNRGVALEDLRQVAYEALVKAANRFDPQVAGDFLAYAVPTMRGELRRYFRDQGWTVRVPRPVQELQPRVTRSREELAQDLGRMPSTSEIAADLDVPEAEVARAASASGCFAPDSLDAPTGAGEGRPLADVLGEEDRATYAVDARVLLAPAVRQLSAREKQILYLRFWRGRTQREIGTELGVTQMQVSRLLSGILQRLRASMDEPVST